MEWQTLAAILPTAFAASFYLMVCTTFSWVMRGRRPLASTALPTVSILKPCAGVDDDLRENFESFARLDYSPVVAAQAPRGRGFEILFGVASRTDPAVPVIEAFLAAHPELDARLVWTRPPRGRIHNPKVAQLLDLTRAARCEVLVVSDANVHVRPGYLRAMVASLTKPGVGLVSSIIAGTGERTLGAALENAQLGAAIAPAVVTGHRLFGRTVTVGKSLAMRKADLERLGGWESVADVLAEDDTLGRKFRATGYGVELCLEPVYNRNVRNSTLRTVDRHARWAKMRRAIVPLLFSFEPISWPLWVATVSWIVRPTELSGRLLACAVLLQVTGALLCHTLLGAKRPLLLALLEPARMCAAFASWCLAAVSRKVSWRGNVFIVGPSTRLTPVSTGAEEIVRS